MSALIKRNLLEVNIVDYYTAEKIDALAKVRRFFVAEADEILGVASIGGNSVYTVFIDPGCHGWGIGRALVFLSKIF